MSSIIISPKSDEEAQFILDLLKRLKVSAMTLSDREKEDWGLGLLMKEADRSQKVSKDDIMGKLAS